MSSLPVIIRIGPVDYRVQEVENLLDDDGVTKLNGHIKHNLTQIFIDKHMDVQTKRVTIWHEVLHGILMQMGFEDQNERLVEATSYGIVSALRDNPWLREEP